MTYSWFLWRTERKFVPYLFGGCFWGWWWFSFFFFSCNIINLQYCVRFRCTAKWLGYTYTCTHGSPGGSVGKESACNVGDLGSIPGLGRSPGEGNGNLLQYSCLQNSIDRGAWWITVHRVTKSWTQLRDWHTHMYVYICIEYSSLRKFISVWNDLKWSDLSF